eukprot:c44892_g1_i1 orf=169-336(+)
MMAGLPSSSSSVPTEGGDQQARPSMDSESAPKNPNTLHSNHQNSLQPNNPITRTG